MPHVTFIHGIANKPPKEKLLQDWETYLDQGGLNLSSNGVSTSMVYWADVMYPKPQASNTNFESINDGLGTDELSEDLSWIDDLPDVEKAFVNSFRWKLGFDQTSPQDDNFAPPAGTKDADDMEARNFEAIPLPWRFKRRVMKTLLKDVHHYLFNARHSPRPGEEYQVQDHIRQLFVEQLRKDKEKNTGGPHVVVGHSMGTVISYDCLKNVPDCPSVSAYLTVGCPLGISEIHDNFDPNHVPYNAFPSSKINGEWVNVYDRLDPVAFDARIADDYLKTGSKVITDQRVCNAGKWRHSSYKYYGQAKLCDHLKRLLDG